MTCDILVAAIQSGDDIEIVQENLGHVTASFTLDVYGHVTGPQTG
jgi:integrase